jgi:hypothetical protein
MKINDLMVANQRANARLPRSVLESNKFHRSLPQVNAQILLRETSIVHRAAAARLSFVDLRVLGG